MRLPAAALVLALASACATTPSSSEPALAPRPFTADQIRDATRPGRTYRYVVEAGGQRTFKQTRFVEVTPDKALMESTQTDETWKPTAEPESEQIAWNELLEHASYPEAGTAIDEVDVEVPAGRFTCKRYLVHAKKDGVETLTRVFFAKELPGMPVLMEVEAGGQRTMTLTMMQHLPGS
jgi:hypothetical protein